MKVKHVIQGLMKKYDLQEINIICLEEEKVYYSGPVNGWKETSVDLILLKRKIENTEVVHKIIFNRKKGFLFITPVNPTMLNI